MTSGTICKRSEMVRGQMLVKGSGGDPRGDFHSVARHDDGRPGEPRLTPLASVDTIPWIKDIATFPGKDAVKLPRLSILSVMWIVVIASINFAALRVLEGPATAFVQILVIVSMPMASILAIGIPTLVKGLLRRGKIPPFLIGFEGIGWTILLFCTGTALLSPIYFANFVEKIVWGWSGLTESRDSFWKSLIFFDMFLFFVPQFLIALAGGWLVGMFKNKVTVERRSSSQSEILS
jgi:hypothetical protein